MFGADTVERKYGRTIPDEWHVVLGRLTDYQMQQGMRRLVYSGKAAVPSLPEFVKLARTVGHDDSIQDEPPAPNMLRITQDEPDPWFLVGNRHLFAYILRKMGQKRTFNEAETRILVRYKNLWTEQMRLSADEEGVPEAEQQEVWKEIISRAEAEFSSMAKSSSPSAAG